MPTIETYRTPGNVHTDTSGFGGGAEGMDPFFRSLAERQLSYQDELRQQQRDDRREQKKDRSRARNEAANARWRERNPPRDPLKHLKTQAEAAQLQAAFRPAPVYKTAGGFNNDAHIELDDKAMTGAQRQIFLPQNAGMERGGLTPGEELAPLRESASIREAAAAADAKRRADEMARGQAGVERAESRGFYGIY